MFFGDPSNPLSLFEGEGSDIWSSLAEGAIKGLLSFVTGASKGRQAPPSLGPQGVQLLQQLLAESQMTGPMTPEMIMPRLLSLGLSPEEAQMVAASYAFQMLRLSNVFLVFQQALTQEILNRYPAEQALPNLAAQRGLNPLETQMALQMLSMSKIRRPLLKQTLHQLLGLAQQQGLSPQEAYQMALQQGLNPQEALSLVFFLDLLFGP